MAKIFISPKQVAVLLGISISTVNYYTNLGLLHSEERKGNMRLYDREGVLRDFTHIKELRKKGYSLKLIGQQSHS
jgi:DNA-binding transcriptional MerR regulator